MRPHRAFNLSFVAATALLVLALGSLAIWSKYSQPDKPTAAEATLAAHFEVPPPREIGSQSPAVLAPTRNVRPKSSAPQLTAQRQALIAANRKAEQQAKEIASWQSPTSSLLGSTSDELFKALPQLNENANELKSFLPSRSNDKEK